MNAMTFPLSKDGVFLTVQGEGALLGEPSVFVRLGGCSVGCKQCDTDYRVYRRATVVEIVAEVDALRKQSPAAEWIWVTGGEPADHEGLWILLDCLKTVGRVALATSGHKTIPLLYHQAAFLSVSPHGKPADLIYRQGSQINLVPGLNGLQLADWVDFDASGFAHRYVTPCDGRLLPVQECRDFVARNKGWKLGVQAHKSWGIA